MAANSDETEHSISDAVHRALRTRDLLLAVLGHDLRNPLNTIVLGCNLLAAADSDPKRRTTIQRMANATQRMERLIRHALFAAQTLDKGVSLTLTTSDMGQLCSALVNEYRERYPNFRVARAGDEHSEGLWDPERIVQALDNLLSNAMKYGDGSATLTLRDDPDRVTISIHNQGRPILAESINTLFDPLQRTNDRSGGVGLGLYIVDQIVTAHQGRVEFESNETEGTTFTLWLPKTTQH